MARHYSTQEALDIIMHSDCEDGSSSSSVDSEADTEEASESTEDASEASVTHTCILTLISHYDAYVLWTSIEPSWQQQKPYRRRLFIEEVGEMLVTPHIKKRGRLPRSSAAATMVSDLQGAAAGPSLISERKSRGSATFAWTEEFAAPAANVGNSYARTTVCPFAAPARPELDSHSKTHSVHSMFIFVK
ncbi:hypothetical protein F7725_001449 [Dissostichus mawsoni]|uniref:Uncharacterized protein n=1 Tax=Dissostichus mawsoni TaxID=36200 RepID=A0A7J5ZHA9_DISMA|nr:hypothetical protein F7725_001449 [Dissostichus mawsoni]